jgi:FkbM family methyltransferase
MNKVFIRKIQSATNLAFKSSSPKQEVISKIIENFRKLKVQIYGQSYFFYDTERGIKFVCLPDSKTSVNLYIGNNKYEDIELQISQTWLEEGDSCLDLGANIGYFSCILANKVTESGKIIAVEASSETCQHLRKALSLLELAQIDVEQCCITNYNGLVDFMVNNQGSSDVKQSLKISPAEEQYFRKESVRAMTLDSLVEKHKIQSHVSLVKMDIEGAEPLALEKSKSLFLESSLPLFIVEIYKQGLSRMGFEPKDIYTYFSKDLFDLYHVNFSYPNPEPQFEYGVIYPLDNPENHPWPWHTNLIAIPKSGKFAGRKQKIINLIN